MMNISIHTSNGVNQDGYSEDNRYSGTYLHGQLQEDMEYDIFSFGEKIDLEQGIHDLMYNGTALKFFLWESKQQYGFFKQWHGLLMYANDDEIDYGYKVFNKKAQVI